MWNKWNDDSDDSDDRYVIMFHAEIIQRNLKLDKNLPTRIFLGTLILFEISAVYEGSNWFEKKSKSLPLNLDLTGDVSDEDMVKKKMLI